MPSIRLFPHSQGVFATPEELADWLRTRLGANGGRYRLLRKGPPKELTRGTVVLFRHGNHIIGEAVVDRYNREPFTEEGVAYTAQVFFKPETIRVFDTPVRVDDLQQVDGVTKNLQGANAYTVIEAPSVYERFRALAGKTLV